MRKKPKTDYERIWNYAENFFQREQREEFPTVRECARSLKLKHSEIHRLIEEDSDMCICYYMCDWNRVPLGDFFIEVINPPKKGLA